MVGYARLVVVAVLLLAPFLGLASAAAGPASVQQICSAAVPASVSGSKVPNTGTAYITNYLNACVQNSLLMSVIALLFSFTLIALAYVVGNVFEFGALKNWYKTEMWENAKSVAAVAGVFVIIFLASAFKTGDVTNLYTTAQSYLSTQAQVSLDALSVAMGIAYGLSYLQSFTLDTYFPLPIPGPCPDGGICLYGALSAGSTQPLHASSILNAQVITATSFFKGEAVNLIIPMMLLLNVISSMFYYFVFIGIGVLLPAGVLFRAIPFLRGIGGMLMALGIWLSIINPILLVAFNMPITNLFEASTGLTFSYTCPFDASGAAAPAGVILCGAWTTLVGAVSLPNLLVGIYASSANFLANSGLSEENIILGFYTGMNVLLYNGANSNNGIIAVLNVLLYYVAPLLANFFALVFDIILGYALANQIAGMLGGSLKLGIGKLKLA